MDGEVKVEIPITSEDGAVFVKFTFQEPTIPFL